MTLDDLSEQERLVLGLRFRLKHIRLAMADVERGLTPEGFDFSPDEPKEAMLADLQALETQVQGMLRDTGADERGLPN